MSGEPATREIECDGVTWVARLTTLTNGPLGGPSNQLVFQAVSANLPDRVTTTGLGSLEDVPEAKLCDRLEDADEV